MYVYPEVEEVFSQAISDLFTTGIVTSTRYVNNHRPCHRNDILPPVHATPAAVSWIRSMERPWATGPSFFDLAGTVCRDGDGVTCPKAGGFGPRNPRRDDNWRDNEKEEVRARNGASMFPVLGSSSPNRAIVAGRGVHRRLSFMLSIDRGSDMSIVHCPLSIGFYVHNCGSR